MDGIQSNLDKNVVKDFGLEWSRFDQSNLSEADRQTMFQDYFSIFPWDQLSADSVGIDIGCGSGRWALLVAPRVGHLHLLEPSKEALKVARQNLSGTANVSFYQLSVHEIPFKSKSLDFAYSLGVLHHVPDTQGAINAIASVLKTGAPFLVYLYYALDQRPWWFRGIWQISNLLRKVISRMPEGVKNFLCEIIALCVYFPLARTARALERFDVLPDAWPLACYRNRAYYVMRTDARDRFGTRLEKRFSRRDIDMMLKTAGFQDIRFSPRPPFWCAVGIKGI